MDQNFINVVKNHLDNLMILSIKKYYSNTHACSNTNYNNSDPY